MQKIIFILVILESLVFSKVLVVDNNPTIRGFWFWGTTTSCENTKRPYRRIQSAIDNAHSGDEIHICDGTYNERVTISNKNNLKIVKSDNATREVYVKNRNDVFTLNGINGIEIDGINICSTRKSSLYLKRYVNGVVLKKLNLKSKKDTIYVKDSMGSFQADGCSIKSYYGNGIYFNNNVNGGLILIKNNIEAYKSAIYVKNNLNAYGVFSNLDIKSSNDIGIYFSKKINNGFKMSHIKLDSKKEGVKFYGELNGRIEIENVKINSEDIGLYFRNKINNGVSIKKVDINSTKYRGIEFYKDVYGSCKILDSNVSAYDRALYINNVAINPKIEGSSFLSKTKSAVYTKNISWTRLSLKNSCIKTEKVGEFALWINTNSINADVTGNCFYASKVDKLAKAQRSGNNVNGNYWDKNSGDYVYNNIVDTSTLSSCNISCFGASAGSGSNTVKNYSFDAWDTDRGIVDRNISTKIVGKDFYVRVASLNEDNDNYQEFNGTVCTCIGEDCFKNFFIDNNISSQTLQGDPKFNILKASKNTKIDIHWLKDVNVNCPLQVEDNTTFSSDNFAIRPEKFTISLPNVIYAKDTFLVDINASSAQDYNETLSNSFTIEANSTKVGCGDGNLSVDSFSFIDGEKNSVAFNYSNIGEINVSIYEKNGSEFAYVDKDDTNETQRFIKPFSSLVVVRPYSINVSQVSLTTSTKNSWIYMSKDIDSLNLLLFAKIVAKDKEHHKLQEFNSSCYAQDLNVSFKIESLNGSKNLSMIYKEINGTFIDNGSKLDDINKTLLLTKNDFIDGDGYVSFVLNVDRNYSVVLNPLEIKDLNVSVSTNNISKIKLSNTDNSAVVFYYGKINTKDIKSNKNEVEHFVEFEVYDSKGSKYVDGLKQNSLNWYQNSKHNSVEDGSIEEINATTRFSLKDTTFNVINIQTPVNGKVYFTIEKHENSYFMHIKTKPWLWFALDSFGDEYNYSVGSDCVSHPCFRYTYIKPVSDVKIKSGKFEGGDIKVRSQGFYKRKGVKLYR